MSDLQFAPPTLNVATESTEDHNLKRRFKKRWILLILGMLLILSVPALLGFMYVQAVYNPQTPSGEIVEITIEEGVTTDQIATQLQNVGLIDQPLFFKLYLRLSGGQSGIQAGNFQIPQHISIADLAKTLGVAKRESVTLRFTEGWRREEMAAYLDREHQQGNIQFTGQQFSQLALNPSSDLRQKLGSRLPAGSSLQGFLFPDTYQFEVDATAEDVLAKMIDTYLAKVSPQIQAGFASQGLTEYEGLILAAIVEREAFSGEERPIIAKILLKRLEAGEILGTDATVQYALGYSESEQRWWKQGLTVDDLAIDSPYNTRKLTGLPPAPICNPGLEAIQAVANPTDTPYMFYLHDSQGKIHYAQTLDEHNANVAKYIQ